MYVHQHHVGIFFWYVSQSFFARGVRAGAAQSRLILQTGDETFPHFGLVFNDGDSDHYLVAVIAEPIFYPEKIFLPYDDDMIAFSCETKASP
jgi:hypothetical protein